MTSRRQGELGIVVVHHKTPAVLYRALERVATAEPGATLVLVDTAPDPAVLARATAAAPGLVVVPTANTGYAAAVNRGIAALLAGPTQPSYVALMNADVLVGQSTFADLTAALDGGAGSIAGPLARTPAGALQDLGPLYALAYRRSRRAGGAPVRVRWLSGCLQVMTLDVVRDLGGYDEAFRFCNEDMEFCLRAAAAGHLSLLVASDVVHLGGTSTPSHPAFHVEGRRGGYLLGERYLPPAVSFLHRGFLRAEALLGGWLARDEVARDAHRRMARLIHDGAWHTSPFGATLDDR